jgi:hypothetical protein
VRRIMTSGHPVQIVLETLSPNNYRKISFRYVYNDRAHSLKGVLKSTIIPPEKIEKRYLFLILIY